MATLNESLYAHLINDTDVAALVSTRVYPGVAPDDATLPYITYGQTGAQHTHHHAGAAGERRVLKQIACWATSMSAAEDLAEKVRVSMHGKTGTFGSGLFTIDVDEILLMNDPHTFVPPRAGDDRPPAWGSMMEFAIWHAEAVPTF
jgi:hypothetical protein